jgi:Na+/proline symporter
MYFFDYFLVVLYFIFAIYVGLKYRAKASENITEFFSAGKSLPWWLAGTSMVATTFAVDAPLAVTELVSKHGIAGNWVWWNFLMSGLLTTFFFAKLWKRANVLTDVEFITLRYSGKAAKILKIFRATYLALPINLIIMGWVTAAMGKIVSLTLQVDQQIAIIFMVLLALFYSLLSGFWGVIITDIAQFGIAMLGSILLAFFSISNAGGLEAVISSIPQERLQFFPETNNSWLPFSTFLIIISVQWWASWYPGAEPGGGGYVAQRMFSTRSEKDSLLATLWFNIAHYAIRPWPWILVAFVSMATISVDSLPTLSDGSPDYGAAYVLVMLRDLPIGVKGLVLASFFAAFMSTIDTHLNWGSSYIINDIYKPYINSEKSEKHYVKISKIVMVFLTILQIVSAGFIESISEAWKFLLAIGAGTGLVYILRWFWYRINVWSEISAMTSAFIFSLLHFYFTSTSEAYRAFLENVYKNYSIDEFGFTLFFITILVTMTWLFVTYLTKPEPKDVLIKFYDKVRPGGVWNFKNSIYFDFSNKFLLWILGIIMIYMVLFGIGHILMNSYLMGVSELILSIFLFYSIRKKINSLEEEI